MYVFLRVQTSMTSVLEQGFSLVNFLSINFVFNICQPNKIKLLKQHRQGIDTTQYLSLTWLILVTGALNKIYIKDTQIGTNRSTMILLFLKTWFWFHIESSYDRLNKTLISNFTENYISLRQRLFHTFYVCE